MQTAVVARGTDSGSKYLAAYVVLRDERTDEDAREEMAKELRRFLRASLPDAMIPQAFEFLKGLPQLPNGKVNRKLLPALEPATPSKERYVAPRTAVEKQLAAIWAEVLEVERVGLHDNFFELGGHSLLAVRIMVQARTALGVDLPVAAMFASPTIAELVEQIGSAGNGETKDRLEDIPIVGELVGALRGRPQGNGQSLAPLRTGGSARPLFCIHGLGGHIARFLPLATGLAEGRPVYGLQGARAGRRSAAARSHRRHGRVLPEEIREVQPADRICWPAGRWAD